MDATKETIAQLLKLQDVDKELARAKQQLDSLPQRALIAEIRKKRTSVANKKEELDALLSRATQDLERIQAEDEHLADRAVATQERIDLLQGDFRSVNALTRDLEGIVKRRETISGEMVESREKIAQMEKLEAKVSAGLNEMTAQEAKLTESFQSEGGALQNKIQAATVLHDKLSQGIPADLLAKYEFAAAARAGVGLATLNGTRCGACRNVIDPTRLVQVKKEAPISTCPSCQRVLIVMPQKIDEQA